MTTRGMPEYEAWIGIKKRCNNPKYHEYHLYGGRGISVCVEWNNSFQSFLSYVGYRPDNNYSIDRINVDGNYEPGNIRWANKGDQNRNRRITIWYTLYGIRHTLKDWARELGIPYTTVYSRYKHNRDKSNILLRDYGITEE